MKVLVIGASGGSGWAAVQALLARGHEVTAFARRAGRLRAVDGDATRPQDLERVVPGHDAVVVTLGIAEPALRVRFRGTAHTAMDVRSTGTRQVIDAMRRGGVRRLVVQSSYGVGPTRERLQWFDRILFALLLKPQIADTERQERLVRDSGLDWVIVQPVQLTDALETEPAHASTSGEIVGTQVSRRQVGAFLADAVVAGIRDLTGTTVSLSGPLRPRDAPAFAAR